MGEISYETDDGYATPLEVVATAGDAHLDYWGCVVPSGEYVAALYESYAADLEETPGQYASAAKSATEDLWVRDVRNTTEGE